MKEKETRTQQPFFVLDLAIHNRLRHDIHVALLIQTTIHCVKITLSYCCIGNSSASHCVKTTFSYCCSGNTSAFHAGDVSFKDKFELMIMFCKIQLVHWLTVFCPKLSHILLYVRYELQYRATHRIASHEY